MEEEDARLAIFSPLAAIDQQSVDCRLAAKFLRYVSCFFTQETYDTGVMDQIVTQPKRNMFATTAGKYQKGKRRNFRIGELNPGLVGTDHLAMIESDKS